MKSIMQKGKYCYVCGIETGLQAHHVFFGSANRKLSDQDGLIVWLCLDHHTGRCGVHNNRDLDLAIKVNGEKAWMEHFDGTEDDFRRRFGKNYL